MPFLASRAAGSAKGFGLTSGGKPPYAVSFLVIGGGGGGAGVGSGGGGAGGFVEGSNLFTPKITYTITVGGGGGQGSDSSITGLRFTTITGLGGGAGG